MKALGFVCAMLLLCSCGPVQFSSQNEPSDDGEALALVGITHQPQPSVVFRSFQAGMDDNLRLVFDLPQDELDAFWQASPFSGSERELLQPHREGDGILDRPWLPDGTEPKWSGWKDAEQGWYAEADLPQARHVRIYVAVEKGKEKYRCYLIWHGT